MSRFAACLFSWLQAGRVYRDLHEAAAATLPAGNGQTWLDVGCGPGLMARSAHARGYRVTGADASAEMIATARRQSPGSGIEFRHADLDALVASGTHAQVVSASSLLAVLPDPRSGLKQLLQLVAPGGTLLVIEAAPTMSVRRAARVAIRRSSPGDGARLLLWAMVHAGRTVDTRILRDSDAVAAKIDLVGGLVTAWHIQPQSEPR